MRTLFASLISSWIAGNLAKDIRASIPLAVFSGLPVSSYVPICLSPFIFHKPSRFPATFLHLSRLQHMTTNTSKEVRRKHDRAQQHTTNHLSLSARPLNKITTRRIIFLLVTIIMNLYVLTSLFFQNLNQICLTGQCKLGHPSANGFMKFQISVSFGWLKKFIGSSLNGHIGKQEKRTYS